MVYKDLINNIKRYEGQKITFIMDSNANNKWFLMMIKEDLLKMKYKIKTINYISSFEKLQSITNQIREKTVIFIEDMTKSIFDYSFVDSNSNCTVIFLCKYFKNDNSFNIFNGISNQRLIFISSFIVSVISDKVAIEKSRVERIDYDNYFYTYTSLRKFKLKIIK